MEKGQLAGNGLAAVIVLGSLGNTMMKPPQQLANEMNGKLDKIIHTVSQVEKVQALHGYRIQQLEKVDNGKISQ